MSAHNYKDLKCRTCVEVLRVDRHTESCQCVFCILADMRRPAQARAEEPAGEQLELAEVAS